MEGINERQYIEKTIKIYDDLENTEDNTIKVVESSNMQIGTGSRVWECGIVLGKYAIKQNLDKGEYKKKNILELGAGTGLLALMLGNLGNNVYATDLKEVLPIMNHNIEGNPKVLEGKGTVKSFELDWNFDQVKIQEIFEKEGVSDIDYIFASDVLYHLKHLELFCTALQNVAIVLHKMNPKAKHPIVLLSHKARENLIDDQLAEELQKKGFYGEQLEEEEMDSNYLSKRIDIFKLDFGMEN